MKTLYPQLHDRDWMTARLDEGLTQLAVAALIGCDPSSVSHAAARLGMRQPGPRRQQPDRATLEAMMDAGTKRSDMAARLGVSVSVLQGDIRRYGLQRHHSTPVAHILTFDNLRELFADPATKKRHVAEQLGCSRGAVEKAMTKHGLTDWYRERRRAYVAETRAERTRQRRLEARRQRDEADEVQKAWLEEQIAAGRSLREIARDLDYDHSSVWRMAKRHGVTMRKCPKKLTVAHVVVIRDRLASGDTRQAIADDFGVSSWTIGEIANRRSWKHVP